MAQNKKQYYEVWILGYNEDDTANDFEQWEATFEDEDKAIWFADNYPFSKPSITPKAKVMVEGVVNTKTGSCCTDIILEKEL